MDWDALPDESVDEDGQLVYYPKHQEFDYFYDCETPGIKRLLEELKKSSFTIAYDRIQRDQAYRFELILEKNTMKDLLLPICIKYGAAYVAFRGTASWGAAWKLCKRASQDQRPTLIFYLSDLDPTGFLMHEQWAEKIAEINIGKFEGKLDIRLKRIGLLPEQVVKYGIPPVEMEGGPKIEGRIRERWDQVSENIALEEIFQELFIKTHDEWNPKYLDMYRGFMSPLNQVGKDGITIASSIGYSPYHRAELDALEKYYPGGIAALVENAFKQYTDLNLSDKCGQATKEALDTIEGYPLPEEIIEKRAEAIRVLEGLLELEEDTFPPDADYVETEYIPIDIEGSPASEEWTLDTNKLKLTKDEEKSL